MDRPDIVIFMTDEERAAPSYEANNLQHWRQEILTGRKWFTDHGADFGRHYTGSLACVPSRPTLFTGQYPDVHGVTQTDGLGKMANDTRLRWLPPFEVPTLGNWFTAAGYDTHYDGKWHISHADLTDPTTGKVLATNDAHGVIDASAVDAYLSANPLEPYGFSGWVGPEPHGGQLANSGFRRDPLIADRVVAWLKDRYARRQAGEAAAQRPFLLVASFVNPHDIVLFPIWQRKGLPFEASSLDPPPVGPSPTDSEDLSTKPAAQIAFRESYPSGYGPPAAVARVYAKNSQEYRNLYYRLHAQGDSAIDQVRQAVTENGSTNALLVRTSDHGDLLGAHGGLHQKWFNLYDEATRVPFTVAGIGNQATTPQQIVGAATSHVDLVPTLLAAASIDHDSTAAELRKTFSEVHPLPGKNLLPTIRQETSPEEDRSVYLMTRDNMLEGDSGASGLARRLGKEKNPPGPLRIQVPAHVAANFEGLVSRVSKSDALFGQGHLWKIVRTYDDPETWTEPGVRHLAATGMGGPSFRTKPLPDQWELYDLDADPNEALNQAGQAEAAAVFALLKERLAKERQRCLATRNKPWPYATRPTKEKMKSKTPPPPARLLRKGLQRLGMHPEDSEAVALDLNGRSALVVATNAAVLEIGKPTGVFASEMTVPYYAFLDAGMEVEVASPLGGVVPVDPKSLKPVLRTPSDDRFLGDEVFQEKVLDSRPIADLDMADYDIVFLAGGWGAAFDFGFSEALGLKMTEANALNRVIGGVCHGPLGLLKAKDANGESLVKGRRISAVTDKQVSELGIRKTPHHPETELRAHGALFESVTKFRDPLANHWVVDGNLITGQNQNAAPMVAREMMELLLSKQYES